MKKVLMIVCAAFIAAAAYADPNEKVLKSFRETFTQAEDVRWDETDNYFTVSFVSAGIRSKVNYNKEGDMMSSIRYYSPQMLPLNIFNKLKKENPKKNLFGVTELTVGNDVSYFVKVEDGKNWYTFKVDESGNYQITEKYKKG
ncbi:hypothetical protein [Paraflavitalea pollutisoli]|uniref:hypothetical protein n=1 Tax=Paraflavitalea pollutisoli TaxID=3034143 RepID=UPI0023EDBDB6|nr:hypothetical protein [Paraflavitalea sp. H1-2-19X]